MLRAARNCYFDITHLNVVKISDFLVDLGKCSLQLLFHLIQINIPVSVKISVSLVDLGKCSLIIWAYATQQWHRWCENFDSTQH